VIGLLEIHLPICAWTHTHFVNVTVTFYVFHVDSNHFCQMQRNYNLFFEMEMANIDIWTLLSRIPIRSHKHFLQNNFAT